MTATKTTKTTTTFCTNCGIPLRRSVHDLQRRDGGSPSAPAGPRRHPLVPPHPRRRRGRAGTGTHSTGDATAVDAGCRDRRAIAWSPAHGDDDATSPRRPPEAALHVDAADAAYGSPRARVPAGRGGVRDPPAACGDPPTGSGNARGSRLALMWSRNYITYTAPKPRRHVEAPTSMLRVRTVRAAAANAAARLNRAPRASTQATVGTGATVRARGTMPTNGALRWNT